MPVPSSSSCPLGREEQFRGVIDLVRMVAYVFTDEMGVEWDETPIPDDMLDRAQAERAHMLETLAEDDDLLMMDYLEGEEISEERLKAAIRRATLDIALTPVLCGSSFKNKGVQMLLDAVVDYLPSPLDVPPVEGINPHNGKVVVRHADDDEPFSAIAFKIMSDPFVGKLTYFRVYSGSLKAGSYVYNSSKDKKERVGRILQMHANHREDITHVFAGDIAAAVGLKGTTTGDTLCDASGAIILESIEFPDPVIFVAIEPKTKADQDRLSESLMKLADEDPTFRVRTDEDTGQTIIAGMGELHLEIIVDRLLREFKVDANVGRPQVAYREGITKAVPKVEGRFVRQTGGRGQYGHVVIKMEPNEYGAGFSFDEQDRRGRRSQGIHPCRPGGHDRGHGDRRAGWLPDGGREGAVDRRLLPRGGLVGDGFQDRGLYGLQGRGQEGASGVAGTHRGRGSGGARGVHGRRHGRPQQSPRAHRGDGAEGGRAGHPGERCPWRRCSGMLPTSVR